MVRTKTVLFECTLAPEYCNYDGSCFIADAFDAYTTCSLIVLLCVTAPGAVAREQGTKGELNETRVVH